MQARIGTIEFRRKFRCVVRVRGGGGGGGGGAAWRALFPACGDGTNPRDEKIDQF